MGKKEAHKKKEEKRTEKKLKPKAVAISIGSVIQCQRRNIFISTVTAILEIFGCEWEVQRKNKKKKREEESSRPRVKEKTIRQKKKKKKIYIHNEFLLQLGSVYLITPPGVIVCYSIFSLRQFFLFSFHSFHSCCLSPSFSVLLVYLLILSFLQHIICTFWRCINVLCVVG